MVLLAATFGASCRNGSAHPPAQVEYVFAAGFRGSWYVVPDSTMPKQSAQSHYVFRFNRWGICRVDPATFEEIDDWAQTTCRVGTKVVDFEHPSDWKVGKLSALVAFGYTTNEGLAKRFPYFYDGLIGDRRDLNKPAIGSNESERLRAALAKEAAERP